MKDELENVRLQAKTIWSTYVENTNKLFKQLIYIYIDKLTFMINNEYPLG